MENSLIKNKGVTLKNGVFIPSIGYGTYDATDEEIFNGTLCALKSNYRLIDCAYYYKNQEAIGRAIKASKINLKDIFISSKVWNTSRGYMNTINEFNKTLKELGVSYLDLYLIHWPANYYQFKDEAKRINQETWRALEDLYLEGKIKAIGLSNFLPHHIEQILETCKIKPMVNQIEFHPGINQNGVISYCKDKGIVLEAYSPLGRKEVLNNEVIVELANKYHKTPAQIAVRYVLETGIIPLPKSKSLERMQENIDVFDFSLSEEDYKKIKDLVIFSSFSKNPDNIDF